MTLPEEKLNRLLDQKMTDGNQSEKVLVSVIRKYMDIMAPRKNTPTTEGKEQQYKLWLQIKATINDHPDDEYLASFRLLYDIIRLSQESTGCFSDRYIFRFLEYWDRNVMDRDTYRYLLTLLHSIIRDGKTKALQTFDMGTIMTNSFNPRGHQRLLELF